MIQLLDKTQLPEWFEYPPQFLKIINQNLTNLDPWYILSGSELISRREGLKQRYPQKNLIPFAKNAGSDDIACWQEKDIKKVFIIHDYAEPGWESRAVYDSFWNWFRQAIEDTIEFDF
jgi:hypothetical protein